MAEVPMPPPRVQIHLVSAKNVIGVAESRTSLADGARVVPMLDRRGTRQLTPWSVSGWVAVSLLAVRTIWHRWRLRLLITWPY